MGSIVAPQILIHLESKNVTGFGVRFSADVIKIRVSR